MIYEIIDTRTGERAKAYELAQEPWAEKTRGCDWPAFTIDEDGDVMLTDDCGNYDMVPEGRVEVRQCRSEVYMLGETLRRLTCSCGYRSLIRRMRHNGM